MALTSGTRLGSRYEVRTLLGAGGMGEVYLAYDHELEREVAIKVLHDASTASSDRVRRFVQEAKAASGLNHPNVASVHEIGTDGDLRFIVMEVVQGETLRQRVGRGAMPVDEALAVGLQIAAALAAAHKAGIVHRDVKPENVILRPDGYAKVLDFGLAKLRESDRPEDAATLLRTEPGIAMGTLGYMAPEQISGGEIRPSADVFSLGVVLYEMITGRRPFGGASATEIVAAVLSRAPAPMSERGHVVPPKLEAVITKSLAKSADDRYPDAGEVLEELKLITRESAAQPIVLPRTVRSKRPVIAAALVIFALIAAVAVWRSVQSKNRVRRAETLIATAQQRVEKRDLAGAFEAASAAAAVLPADDRVRQVLEFATTKVTIESEPSGAKVFMQRVDRPVKREAAGVTPLTIERALRVDYVVALEKEGYATAVRPLSIGPIYFRDFEGPRHPSALKVKLNESAKVPPDMVAVEGGQYRLQGWSRAIDRPVILRDFLIDRYEVSNSDFVAFVRDGGYRRRELWKHPFVIDGKPRSFEQAMAHFQDRTGLPGPRSWSGGAPLAGKENHPVTDVSWYEADAFAAWKGKKLPTIYQWEKAARFQARGPGTILPWAMVGHHYDVTKRANFSGTGTMAVDSMPSGISPWGAHHMAGNVWEWCRNPAQPGYVTRGGSWNDPVYSFGRLGRYPGSYSSPTLGFRCVKESAPAGDDQGGFALGPEGFVPAYRPTSDSEYATIRAQYEYSPISLDVRLMETVKTRDWTRETISYNGGKGSRATAYLYLPNGFRRPLQVVHFSPAGDVTSGMRPLAASLETSLGSIIRGGRAVFSVIEEGFLGRPVSPNLQQPDTRSIEFADFVVSQVTELRRGLDYLATRKDLDLTRLAFIGPSAGSWNGVILTAVDPRYRSVQFIGTGIDPTEIGDVAAASRMNFAPRIAPPKMMVQGRYDETCPLDFEAQPLFRLLREPKRLEVFEGGHVPLLELYVPIAQKWLDETLGPVTQ